MSKYKGLFTFDEDSHKYIPIPIAGAEGIIDTIGHEPAEPLIKDEKIRKAVRAWAEAEDVIICRVDKSGSCLMNLPAIIQFWGRPFVELNNREYSIAELCGGEEE